MKNQKIKIICETIAEWHNAKIDAINSGLSPIEYLKSTEIFVMDRNGYLYHAKEWHVATELEKYYKNEPK